MTLTLTSCTRVREPGFSPSECMELARRIDNRLIMLRERTGNENDLSLQQVDMIVAALRTYANA